MQASRRRIHSQASSRGAALLISIMVTVVLTLLGLTYLFQADIENQIARSERDRVQLLGVAEGGARMVKHWFDQPIRDDITAPSHLFLNTYDIRKKKYFDVNQRRINDDGNPATPAIVSGDPNWVYYMQGVMAPGSPVPDTDPEHALTLFQKPYRGSTAVTLMGTEDGPDIVISEDSASADVRGFLQGINDTLFGDTSHSGRITKIELYEPPYVQVGAAWERYGIGTVKVTASKFRLAPGGGEVKVATRVVEMVLNEIPYTPGGPFGMLHSCTDMDITGSFEGHWGLVSAMQDIEITTGGAIDVKWDSGVARLDPSHWVSLGVPWDPADSYSKDLGQVEDAGVIVGTILEDPWLNLRAFGFITDAPSLDPQAWPTAYVAGDNPAYDEASDHSNLFQLDPTITCPNFPYDLWKSIAQGGGNGVHYLSWVADDLFREGEVVKTFANWTHNQAGLFFFDTRDAKEPNATDSNLTPPIKISGTWYARGFFYLNTENFRTTGGSGVDVALIPPGEPYEDTINIGLGYAGVYNAEPFTDWDGNGVYTFGEPYEDTISPANGGIDGSYDAEPWVNLNYDTVMSSVDRPDHRVVYLPGTETFEVTLDGVTTSGTTTNARDASGLPVVAEINLYGMLYNNGAYSAQGNAGYYGSIIARNGVGLDTGGAGGTPNIYYDHRLQEGEWPPAVLGLPLTLITAWNPDTKEPVPAP